MKDFEKILLIVESQGVSTGEIERKSGLSPSSLTHLLERKGNLHKDNAVKIQRTFGISEEWWRTGKGEMLLGGSHNNPTPVTEKEEKFTQSGALLMAQEYEAVIKYFVNKNADLEAQLAECKSKRSIK